MHSTLHYAVSPSFREVAAACCGPKYDGFRVQLISANMILAFSFVTTYKIMTWRASVLYKLVHVCVCMDATSDKRVRESFLCVSGNNVVLVN